MRVSAGSGLLLEGIRVLLMDDHLAVREVITRLLEAYGASVIAVPGVEEAFRAFIRQRPDIVVSDLDVPGMGGALLVERVRALPREHGGQTPAVALTGSTSAAEEARALRAGFHCAVAKPVDARRLVTALQTLASGTRRRKTRRSVRVHLDGAHQAEGHVERMPLTHPAHDAPPRILVVDDEPDLREVVVDVLRAAAYDVDVAADGAEALDLLARQPYDLVVSDLSMPRLDGRDLYREMQRRFPSPPRVVFVTGDMSWGRYSEFLAEVEAPVLPKPFELASILTTVRAALGVV